jgi:hypothetical protein
MLPPWVETHENTTPPVPSVPIAPAADFFSDQPDLTDARPHPRPMIERPRDLDTPCPPGLRIPEHHGEMLIESWVVTLAILTCPLWLPVLLVLLPVRLIRDWFADAAAEKEKARRAPNPRPAPTRINEELEKRRLLARQKRDRTLLRDPIAEDPACARAIEEAQRRATAEIGGYRRMGDCHLIWNRAQQILKDDFDIKWFTPAEMNPHIIFD